MPLLHARMIRIGRRVYRYRTRALALASPISSDSTIDSWYLPLGLAGGKAPVGMQCMLWEDHPSSEDSVLVVSPVGQVSSHKLTHRSPDFSIILLDIQNSLKIFNRFIEIISTPCNRCYSVQGQD